MPSESIRHTLEQASTALRQGEPKQALAAADRVLAVDPSSAEAFQLKGIALTGLGDLRAANSALQRAVDLAPTEAKHLYNLAVNLRDLGRPEEALSDVEGALRLDPGYEGALRLRAELTGVALPEEAKPAEPQPMGIREGWSGQRHVLPFLNGMERVWLAVGWVFLAFNVVLAVLMLVHLPMYSTGHITPPNKLPDVELRRDSLSIFTVFLYIVTWICTFMWMFTDIIDLRRRFSWLVPVIACSIPGYGALPMLLYLTVGRRIEPPDTL